MAAFADDEANRSRVDFRILRDRGLRLYHSASILEEDLLGLQGEGYTILGFDCRAWRSEADFHEDVADVLKFPDYYGRNLDAFNDCMGDVVVPEQGGLAPSLPRRGSGWAP
jgi:Barstar (barnase inhibitor)